MDYWENNFGAKSVFELGSGFGHSTAWFARAVTENGEGKVYHVVWDEELSRQALTNRNAHSQPGLDRLAGTSAGWGYCGV